jgi:hypothetical protein
MTHFLDKPLLLAKVVNKKKQQLKTIQEELAASPLEHPSRPSS